MNDILVRAKAVQDAHTTAFHQFKRAQSRKDLEASREWAGIAEACLAELAECMWGLREAANA